MTCPRYTRGVFASVLTLARLDCAHHRRRNAAGLRVPAARSRLLLRPVSPRPLRRGASPRYRSAPRGAGQVASRRRTRARLARQFRPYGRVPPPCAGHLRFPHRFRDPACPNSVILRSRLVACVKIATYNHHCSAPSLRASVVSQLPSLLGRRSRQRHLISRPTVSALGHRVFVRAQPPHQ